MIEKSVSLNSKFNLLPVWDAILDVYKPISEILTKHGITFWAAFGTVLGAVRHRGFIPWDDDFDICVPNTQMDQAIAVLQQELPKHLKVVTSTNTPEMKETYAKVQDSRVEVVHQIEIQSRTSRPHGIYVDIFPVDGIPDRPLGKLILRIKTVSLYCLWNSMFNLKPRKSWRYYIGVIVACAVRPFFLKVNSDVAVQEVKRKWAQKNKFGTTNKCGRYIGNPRQDFSYETSTINFENIKYLDFEGIQVPVPGNYEKYLSSLYGDWRRLPPYEVQCNPSHESLFVAPWKYGPTSM